MSYPYQITSLEQYHSDYKKSVEDPEEFWGNVAENFYGERKWDKVLNWNFKEPKIEWFKGGKLNILKIVLTAIWTNWEKNLPSSGNQITLKKESAWLPTTGCTKGFASLHRC